MKTIKDFVKSNVCLYVILLLFSFFLACLCNDYDYDLYARLIVGENFVEQGVLNYKDFLSYTPTHTWYDHEWGSSLIFYSFYKLFGALGFVILQTLTMFLIGLFVIKTQRLQKNCYPASITFMMLFLLLIQHQNPSLTRCHMFSFVFFTMFLYFLEKTRISYIKGKNSNILWFTLPLSIIWNNLHGGIFAGIGIIFIYMLGAFISKQEWKKYLYVIIGIIPLLLINPYGYEYIRFLLSANTMTRKFVTEWWSVFAQRHVIYYYPQFLVSISAIFIMIKRFINKEKIDIIKIFITITTVYLGIVHVKLLSLPLIVIASLYYNDIVNLFDTKKRKMIEKFSLVIAIICIISIPFLKPAEAKTKITKFPVKEVEFIKINNIKGNVLTEFGLGSYVSYKLYPNNLIYMDGRYEEVYNEKEFNVLMNYELANETWKDIINKYPTEILLPEKNIPVYQKLETLQDWVKIYEGDICGIFVKRSNLKNNYKLPTDNINYYQKEEFTNMGHFGKNKDRKNNKG